MASTYSWISVNDPIKPENGQIVNVCAKDFYTGETRQFLAVFSSWKMHGKDYYVFNALGGEYLFDVKTVSHWTHRMDCPSTWSYKEWR